MDTSSSLFHFNRLAFTQARLVELMTNDGIIRAKLISIQTMLIPHLEVMQREFQSKKEIVQRDPNLFIVDSLID